MNDNILVFGERDDEQPEESPDPTSPDAVERLLAELWAYAAAHGVTPLKAREVAGRVAAGRDVYEYGFTSPDGERDCLMFDVTDAEPGALADVTAILREVGFVDER